ncbi:hypothetical protein PENANT_c023G00114 [Penicillium antarcticum]|uniref:Nucleoporin Nup54 alpha-helical domain-containing protein n=1 Tax=Penicillium antarcticum TaxID=416450 RepID=A0A1V6PZF2_9EURO|nr:uncharacterized protein N7508_006150 [Penicillium antarcticum]KAJ5301287.1 hypothetical protein N7508_006150 [Penicillium antarcticum]OQD82157.1 hypothetical protein PENANT_c023G00114 [Penicillium antarcticum]
MTSLFGGAAQNTGSSLFGNTANKSPFGGTTTNTQPTGGGLFGQQNQQQGSLGGSTFGASTTTPQTQQPGGLFGNAQKPQNSLLGGSTFGQPAQQQPQQQSSAFGTSLGQKPQGSLFGGTTSGAQAPATGMFGQQNQQQQAQQPQQSQFGQTTMATPQGQQQQPPLASSLWSPGRAITGVHRTVPMQMAIVKDKWDPPSQSSPFRAYIYNNVGEEAAPFYQPGPDDDHTKWEEALRKRPGPGYVPVLVRGFWELGKRAQRQRDFLTMIQSRLHEINNCLTELLSKHDLNLSIKIADARRKHIILSKRCLALAAKTQILRNRGYAMDEAEEELKKKLTQLERSVFDPSINGRGEEIWARMLAIHEHSKRLQAELDRAGVNVTPAEDDIDEQTLKTAKKILDDYHSQIQHLQKEMESIKKDFEEAKSANGN